MGTLDCIRSLENCKANRWAPFAVKVWYENQLYVREPKSCVAHHEIMVQSKHILSPDNAMASRKLNSKQK